MIGWIWRFLVGRFGCEHQWSTEESYRVMSGEDLTYIDKNLRCTKCGDWKRVRL